MANTISGTPGWGAKSDIGTSAAQLVSTILRADDGVQVKADPDNTGSIFVGFDNTVTVSGVSNDTDGHILAAGESILLPVRNPNDIYVISDQADQRLHYMIMTKSDGYASLEDLDEQPPYTDNLKILLTPRSGFESDAAADFTDAAGSKLKATGDPLQLNDADYVISFWFYPDDSGTTDVLCEKADPTNPNYEWGILTISNTVYFTIGTGSGPLTETVASAAYTVGAWNHVVCWHDKSAKQIHISLNNAAPITTTYSLTAGNGSGYSFMVGGKEPTTLYDFNGRIDSLMVFEPSDVTSIITELRTTVWNSGNGTLILDITTAQRAAWGISHGWEFDEDTGNDRIDSIGSVDLSEVTASAVLRGHGLPRSVSIDGDAVGRWLNAASGESDNYFIQDTYSRRPTLVDDGTGQNGLAYLAFDGIDDFMDCIEDEDVFNTEGEITVILGMRLVHPGANSLDTPIDSAGSNPGLNKGFQVLNEHRDAINIDESINMSIGTVSAGYQQWGTPDSYPATAIVIWDGSYSDTDTETYFLNGIDQAPYTDRTGSSATGAYDPRSGTIRIGDTSVGGQPCEVDFYFILYYAEQLSTEKLAAVRNWINSWMRLF